ncbi:MAG: LamG domain-containing protein [Deltaproteobacteria bacterium]|nr:LamG domain-containing protein [Deltaproteobacteria bacterium]
MVRGRRPLLVLGTLALLAACTKFESVDELDAGGTPDAGAADSVADGTTTTRYESAVLADKPVVFWRFRDQTTTIADRGRAGIPMTASTDVRLSRPSLVNESADHAIQMVVNDTLQTAPTPADWFAGTKPYTIECWLRVEATGLKASSIVMRGTPTSGIGLTIGSDGTVNALRFEAAGKIVTGSPLTPVVSHHLVATYDGTLLALYVDGKAVDSKPASESLNAAERPITVGAPQGASTTQLEATIDELAFYDSALSASAVIAHAKAGGLPL